MALDQETEQLFTQAYAAFLKRTDPASGYVPPPEYKPKPKPVWRPNFADAKRLDVPTAIRWVKLAEAYQHRLGTPVTRAEMESIWELYKYRYARISKDAPPWDDWLSLGLAWLQWHDVMERVKRYVSKKETYDSKTHTGGSSEPFELITNIAAQIAKDKRKHSIRRCQAIRYLRHHGIDLRKLDDDAARRVVNDWHEAHLYPRTYL